jgi:hypothetical protein
VADTRDRGFSEELDDLLRRSEKLLQQELLACFAIFLWVHNVHKLLGGSPEVLQLLLPLLPLFAQRFDLLKAADELLFFTLVSSSSLYVKIFLSSAVKIFSESKINY